MSEARAAELKIRQKWLKNMPDWDSKIRKGIGSTTWLMSGYGLGTRIPMVQKLYLKNCLNFN